MHKPTDRDKSDYFFPVLSNYLKLLNILVRKNKNNIDYNFKYIID
jgi:hypothetical protein